MLAFIQSIKASVLRSGLKRIGPACSKSFAALSASAGENETISLLSVAQKECTQDIKRCCKRICDRWGKVPSLKNRSALSDSCSSEHSSIASGNLTSVCEAKASGEVGTLIQAMNDMQGSLRDIILRLTTNASTLSTSSSQLSQTAGSLSAGADEATSQSTAVSAAAEEMAASMSSVSGSTNEMTDSDQTGDSLTASFDWLEVSSRSSDDNCRKPNESKRLGDT